MGSRAQAPRLWHTGSAALWHVESSRPGIEPVSPALAGRFLCTVPLGKSGLLIFVITFLADFFKVAVEKIIVKICISNSKNLTEAKSIFKINGAKTSGYPNQKSKRE